MAISRKVERFPSGKVTSVLRWLQVWLITIALFIALVAILERSDGPFVNDHFAHTMARAKPLGPAVALDALPKRAGGLVHSIDAIGQGATHLTLAGRRASTFTMSGAAPITIDGWAIDQPAHAPAAGIVALIDDRAIASVPTGSDRPDVAAAFADPKYLASGFHLEISSASVPAGRHRLTFLIVDAQRTATVTIDIRLSLHNYRIGSS